MFESPLVQLCDLVDERKSGFDNTLAVDAGVVIEVITRPGLPKAVDTQGCGGRAMDAAQPRQRMRRRVMHRNDRSMALARQDQPVEPGAARVGAPGGQPALVQAARAGQ